MNYRILSELPSRPVSEVPSAALETPPPRNVCSLGAVALRHPGLWQDFEPTMLSGGGRFAIPFEWGDDSTGPTPNDLLAWIDSLLEEPVTPGSASIGHDLVDMTPSHAPADENWRL